MISEKQHPQLNDQLIKLRVSPPSELVSMIEFLAHAKAQCHAGHEFRGLGNKAMKGTMEMNTSHPFWEVANLRLLREATG